MGPMDGITIVYRAIDCELCWVMFGNISSG